MSEILGWTIVAVLFVTQTIRFTLLYRRLELVVDMSRRAQQKADAALRQLAKLQKEK
jgi:hypothetical protein